MDLLCALVPAKFNSSLPKKGREASPEMKPSIVLAGAITAQAQSITDTEGFPRLPSVFRNCEEPLPWYCARPTGLLWFGSIATIQHSRRAASLRASPEFLRR